MQIVGCLCYGKGEYPGKEVVQIVEATTRGRERSPHIHSLCLNRKKDPQPYLLLWRAHRLTGNSAFDRLALPFLLYLHFRRSSRSGRGWPGARSAGG